MIENDWFMNTIEKGLAEIEQEKKLPNYFSITAINSIPYINYPGFSPEELVLLQERAKNVLRISRNENQYNEVTITYRKDNHNPNDFFKVKGSCSNIFLDNNTLQLLNNTDKNNELIIISIHNHPNDSTFSVNDLLIFAEHSSIKLMEVINTKGEIAFLLRSQPTDLQKIVIRTLTDNIPDFQDRINKYKRKNPNQHYKLTEITTLTSQKL